MKFLITGAAGSLGRQISGLLEKRGEVWQSTRTSPFPAGDSYAHPLTLDVTDNAGVCKVIGSIRPDTIIHLAAYVDVQGAIANPMRAWNTNLEGTLNLLEACRKEGLRPRFIFASTAHVYGQPVAGEEVIRESHLPRPASPYAASKLAAEHAALVYFRQYGVESIVVRIFNVVGPGQPVSSVCSALAERVAAVAAGKAKGPILTGKLDSVRDFIPVDDAVAGLAAAAISGRPGETYNLCTGKGTSVRDILDALFAAAGSKFDVEADPKLLRAADPVRVVGDPEKLAKDTGFRAKGDVRAALFSLYRERLACLESGGRAGAA